MNFCQVHGVLFLLSFHKYLFEYPHSIDAKSSENIFEIFNKKKEAWEKFWWFMDFLLYYFNKCPKLRLNIYSTSRMRCLCICVVSSHSESIDTKFEKSLCVCMYVCMAKNSWTDFRHLKAIWWNLIRTHVNIFLQSTESFIQDLQKSANIFV